MPWCLNTAVVETKAGGVLGWSGTSLASDAINTGISRDASGVVDIGNGTAQDKSGFIRSGMTVRVASNFTTAANTNLQNIVGLTWTLPNAGTQTFSFACDLAYSQATANAAVAFGINAVTAAPTNIFATATMGTSLTAETSGTLPTLTTTTPTAIVSATPSTFGPIGTVADIFTVHIGGTIENPLATANTFTIMVSTATAADAVTIYRGSACYLTP